MKTVKQIRQFSSSFIKIFFFIQKAFSARNQAETVENVTSEKEETSAGQTLDFESYREVYTTKTRW